MKFLVFLFASLCASSAHASFSGTFKSSSDFYPISLGEPTDDLVPYLVLDLNGKYKLNKKLRFQWRGYALSNLESTSAPENFYGDLPEAFFEWKAASDFRVRAGMNTVNWGVVDISSPSDMVNTSAFFHPMRTLKRGAPMVELDWDKETIGFHAIYIPVQQHALLPSKDSRWLPRTLLINAVAEGHKAVIPKFLEYEFLKDEELTHALSNNYGARLSSHLGSVDLFLMHFEGSAPQPKVRPKVDLDVNVARSPVGLRPVHYRVRTSSLGGVIALEKFIVRLESAYQHTISKDDLLQPWSWSNVLAVETNVNLGSSSLMILAQYYHTENPQEPDNLISSSYRLFDRTGLLGFRWAVSDPLVITSSILYETNTQGVFWMAGFEQKLSDVLRWGLAWRDFSAQEDGLIKTFDKNDHANLELIYYF